MDITLKQIAKPTKFNQKAFQQEIMVEMSKVARDIRKDYEKTTTKWKRKPKFTVTARIRPSFLKFFIGTDNKIYAYVDLGTRPHIILPRRRKVLRWIGKGYGGRGRPKKGDYVFAARVFHPGFKGYQHTKKLKRKWDKLFKRRMRVALGRGVKASGHQFIVR